MKWSIVADTSCDLFRHDIANDQVDFVTIPFSIHIGEDVYIDDESLDPAVLVDQMETVDFLLSLGFEGSEQSCQND